MRSPDIRCTRSTYCCAISWKGSGAGGHDDCILRTTGDCAVTTAGIASEPAAAPAATAPVFRNLRREISSNS
jgi:hypothetical protein